MRMFKRLRSLAARSFFHLEDVFGMYRLAPNHQPIVSVLMYHGLETDPQRLACNDLDVTPESCLKEIRFFQKQGYKLISADELDQVGRMENGNRGYLIVTVDDGHLNTYEHLRNWIVYENIPVTIAVCPGIVDRNAIFWWEEIRARLDLMKDDCLYVTVDGETVPVSRREARRFEDQCRAVPHESLLSALSELRALTDYLSETQIRASKYVHRNMDWEQVATLARHPRCTIASHSLWHEIAVNVSPQELRHNTEESKRLLEARTGRRVRHYIYPNGECSDATDRIIRDCEFDYTYSVVDATNSTAENDRILNRLRGVGFAQGGFRHYARRWKKRHQGLV